MPTPPPTRSVKIGQDERTGWSSDRPRRSGAPERPADMSVRGRVLRPSDRLRYSPGSLVYVVSASKADRDRLVERVVEDKPAVLSADRVRKLLAGRVADDELEERAAQLLDAAVLKRLSSGHGVVLVADGLDSAERDRVLRLAAGLRRPRHLILVETARDQVAEEDLAALNDLRRILDSGGMGAEGFHTALRLGGGAVEEVKRLVFRAEQRDDD
ncbi:MAG TPA: AAA family ATPase [Solirubrobacteraceae bacterium]|nr:AAA family ATPase [Solirubrobacteraceae bacterium]